MKRILFLTFAVALSFSVYAQTSVFQRNLKTTSNAHLSISQRAGSDKVSIRKIEPSANQVWWGYQPENEERNAVGVSKTETYDAALFIAPGNSVIMGKAIKAIRFYLRDKVHTNNVKIWISKSLPDNINNADYIQSVDQASLNAGDEGENMQGMVNDVKLTTPYIIGNNGIYIGYTVTITDASEGTTKFPIVNYSGPEPNSFFIRTSKTATEWTNLAEEGFGQLALQVLIEGDFAHNSVSPSSLQNLVVVKNTTGKSKLVLFNAGTEGINSIDYTITTNGIPNAEQHLVFNSPVRTMGAQCTISLPLAADANTGIAEKTITITKVNGKTNESENKSTTCKLTTVNKQVKRGVVIEENTGTGCGWCPRGWAGMKKLRDKFADSFVGIAIHQYNETDVMYCRNYAKLNFGEAPTCKIDRNDVMDPFYGSDEDICVDFKEALARIATVGVSVTGELNADKTEVTATATIEPLVNGTYEIAYALIGDGLTGTENSWQQSNNYSKYAAANVANDPYLALFCKGGKYSAAKVTLVYDDVLLSSSYNSNHNNNAKLEPLKTNHVVTNTYTFKLPNKKLLKEAITRTGYNKLAVIAMIINNEGKIDNAAKFYLSDPVGIGGISENNGELREVARYTIDGRKISVPQRGLNIVKLSDGSTIKILIK